MAIPAREIGGRESTFKYDMMQRMVGRPAWRSGHRTVTDLACILCRHVGHLGAAVFVTMGTIALPKMLERG